MKKMLFAVLVAALTLTSCGGNKNNSKAEEPAALSVDQVLEKADSLTNQLVTVEGVCTHTCRHGATKIFLMGSNDDNILRCEAAALGAFSKDCVKNVVRVTGYVRETRMDEAYLQNWKQRYEEAVAEQQAQAVAEAQFGEPSAENNEEVSTATGCATESKARREQGNTIDEKIEAYRAEIAQRKEVEGKEYLSFYHIEATAYEVVPVED